MKPLQFPALAVVIVAALSGLGCGSGNHLTSVAISPNPVDMFAPQVLQLQAIGHYSDGSTKVLGNAMWTISTPSPAVTVDSKGMANCQVSGGPAATAGTVTASFQGVSGDAVISCSGPGV